MPREDVQTKGRRYVVEGRLTIKTVSPTDVIATVKGSGQVHAVGYRRGGWWCTCEARTRCSHLVALQLVVCRPGDGGGRP